MAQARDHFITCVSPPKPSNPPLLERKVLFVCFQIQAVEKMSSPVLYCVPFSESSSTVSAPSPKWSVRAVARTCLLRKFMESFYNVSANREWLVKSILVPDFVERVAFVLNLTDESLSL